MTGDFRTWLAGYLEGLAGREIPDAQIDAIVRRFEASYRGGGAVVQEAQAPVATVSTPDPTPTQQKYPPRRAKKAQAPLENSTPVADAPPYTPDDPMVVRLG